MDANSTATRACEHFKAVSDLGKKRSRMKLDQ